MPSRIDEVPQNVRPDTNFPEKEQALKKTFGHIPAAVAIITTCARDSRPVGLTVSAFTPLSLTPPLLLWCIDRRARSLAEFNHNPYFAINLLASDQQFHCRLFSSPERDRFSQIGWSESAHQIPLIDNVAAILECRTTARYPGGDHEIFVGEILQHNNFNRPPMIYRQGKILANTFTQPL